MARKATKSAKIVVKKAAKSVQTASRARRGPADGSRVRLATFNCENLFARYRFRENFDPTDGDGFQINNLAFDIYDEPSKSITAKAIAETKADIVVLQEVENLIVLDRFHSRYLTGGMYRHRLLIDGNDSRQIDIAILSAYPIVAARSHRHERNAANSAELFSRDCLEADIQVDGRVLTIYANHLKSMMGGRAQTAARRREQAERIAELIDDRFGAGNHEGNFVVAGDLNDYPTDNTSLGALLGHAELVNVLDRAPAGERWTHYYKGGNLNEKTKQLDYLLLGREFDARAGKPVPGLMRKGLPHRAEAYAGERFEGVGEHEPKASDHCPLYVDIPVAALV